jgi:hypothetical protein
MRQIIRLAVIAAASAVTTAAVAQSGALSGANSGALSGRDPIGALTGTQTPSLVPPETVVVPDPTANPDSPADLSGTGGGIAAGGTPVGGDGGGAATTGNLLPGTTGN